MRNNKGISLVALVVTIVVLIILVGVSISFAIGDNGILTNARVARDETNSSNAKEALSRALETISSDFYQEHQDVPENLLSLVTKESIEKLLPSYKDISLNKESEQEATLEFKDSASKTYCAKLDKHLMIVSFEKK